FFKLNPDFINNGIVNKVIREKIGSTWVTIPVIITQYVIIGKIHTALDAFFLPNIITRVFLPPALSASKSGNELTNNTREDKTPTTIPPSIGSTVICEVCTKDVPSTIMAPFMATKISPNPESTILVE